MKKFLIESIHGSKKRSCIETIKAFLKTGNHLLTRADWGGLDGVHKG
jgi:hypothetical protein